MKAKALMILGTASHVGKSVIAAGFCRLLSDAGYRVAPFKAQNMSNNSFVTKDGGEMGRAQVVQAECARVEPHTDMNPILLKPSQDNGSQVIVQGKAIGHFEAQGYYAMKAKMAEVVRDSYERLASQYEIIVMEGAGSCAEINLKENDIVNMKMAEMADARCLLVGDIDTGGIFASMIGTIDLLSENERARIAGLIINKFRGDRSLFEDGIKILQEKTGKKIWGIIPYDRELWIDAEDGVSLERENTKRSLAPRDLAPFELDIAVVQLPRISNFTDFEILRQEPGVRLRIVSLARQLGNPDLLILPGTKSTLGDLEYLRKSGFEEKIKTYYENGGKVFGICGGFQMLGEEIIDPQGIESQNKAIKGLGLFKMRTEFFPEKVLRRITEPVHLKLFGASVQGMIEGYEIHMGKTTEIASSASGLLAMTEAISVHSSGRAAGTYIHGIFDSPSFRRSFLNALGKACGKQSSENVLALSAGDLKEIHYNRLARLLADHLDLNELQECLQLSLPLSLI
ncbi:MAG: cobyric acid synthase [Candidatus Omnitrophica bacterium]|nr:cobyric acid synthase [Candidatus Omnitrophota bacterium]